MNALPSKRVHQWSSVNTISPIRFRQSSSPMHFRQALPWKIFHQWRMSMLFHQTPSINGLCECSSISSSIIVCPATLFHQCLMSMLFHQYLLSVLFHQRSSIIVCPATPFHQCPVNANQLMRFYQALPPTESNVLRCRSVWDCINRVADTMLFVTFHPQFIHLIPSTSDCGVVCLNGGQVFRENCTCKCQAYPFYIGNNCQRKSPSVPLRESTLKLS